MREGRGRIINVASMYGLVAPCHTMSHTAYAAAKHGELPSSHRLPMEGVKLMR